MAGHTVGGDGSALAHYEGIKALSEVDQPDDLKAITMPTFVMQGADDQIVPYKDASLLQAKLLNCERSRSTRILSRHDDCKRRGNQCRSPGIHQKRNFARPRFTTRFYAFGLSEVLLQPEII